MPSFQLPINSKDSRAARFITHVHRELQRALLDAKTSAKITQQALAQKLGINRSVVNRLFLGQSNVTLRTIAEIAWALNLDITFELKARSKRKFQNFHQTTSSLSDPDALRAIKSPPRPVKTATEELV